MPSAADLAFRLSLIRVRREVKGWLPGPTTTDPIDIQVRAALVNAYRAGLAEGGSVGSDNVQAAYERGYDAGSDAATEGADYSHSDDV